MFPRIVTIAPGEGARRRQVPPSSTIPRASHPSTTTSPSSRAANYSVCSVLPTDGRPMRKRDYGRWTCISFRPFLSFSPFLLSPLLFSFPHASGFRVFCFLSCCSSSSLILPFLFFPYIQEFPGEIENIGTECDAILKIVSNGSEYGNRGFIHRLEKS